MTDGMRVNMMRQSSKYILGGIFVFVSQSAFVAVFGWPQRVNYPSPQAIGLFVVALFCLGYGVFLRITEPSFDSEVNAPIEHGPATQARQQGFGRKPSISKPDAATLPRGEAMTDRERSDFESLFRRTVEQRPLSEADTMLRNAIYRLDDPILKTIIERPAEEAHVDRWPVVETAMKHARDGLANSKMGSMILGLIHRNSVTLDMTIALSFAKNATPAPVKKIPRFASIQTEAQYQALVEAERARMRLPEGANHKQMIHPPLRLVGMEMVRPVIEREYLEGEDWQLRKDQINAAKMLGAALVFLRFCQAAERHLNADTGAPRLPTYLTVEAEPWPMESGTIDYCNHAVRLVPAHQLGGVDRDGFKAFAIQSLRPDILLVRLREQRSRQPGYGYCNLSFQRFSIREANAAELDDLVLQANEDEDVRAAVARVSDFGFHVKIGTYDEPSGRDLQVSVKQDEEAEFTMRMIEGLD